MYDENMRKMVQLYRLKLVREAAVEYIGSVKGNKDLIAISRKLGLADYSEEYFFMFAFNCKGEVLSVHEISHGDLNSSAAHPREIFKRAFLCNAGSIAFVHNHPSGDATPSETDVDTTKRMVECGKLLGIPIIDHIILAKERAVSMKEEGIIS